MEKSFGRRIIRFIAVGLSITILSCLSACFDLGTFEEDGSHKGYYSSFGTVEGMFDGGEREYDIEDSLFSDYTVNNMGWKDEDDEVKDEEYLYIVLPFECEMKIESIALFVKSDIKTTLEINSFYYESESLAPAKIKYKSSPDTEIIEDTDEDGNPIEREVEIEYDDSMPEESIADAICETVSNEWSSFILGNFNQQGYGDGFLHTGKGGMIYVRINQNSGLFRDKETCSFKFINLLVRAV